MVVVSGGLETPGLDGVPIHWPDGTVWPPPPTPPASTANLADFGPNVSSVEVDAAVIQTLVKWMPTYLRYVSRSRELDFPLALPKHSSYVTVIDAVAQWPDNVLPAIVVATSQVEGTPVIAGSGDYVTGWRTALSAIVRGRNALETRRTASYTELAARLVLVQQMPREGFAKGVRWLSGAQVRPMTDPGGRGRWLAEGASDFLVLTDAAVREGAGPTQPDQEPYDALATVTSIDLEVDAVPINGNVGGS